MWAWVTFTTTKAQGRRRRQTAAQVWRWGGDQGRPCSGFKKYDGLDRLISAQVVSVDNDGIETGFGFMENVFAYDGDMGGPDALRNFTVDRAWFTNNICGVYSSGVIGFVAKRNTIKLGGRNVPLTGLIESPSWYGRHRGIYSFSGYGFIVDDNTLLQQGSNLTEGIVIGHSRDHNDMVFRNHATNLERAYIGEGQCIDPNSRAVKGLHFQCNENTDNGTNFWSRFAGTGDAADQSIRTNQGTPQRVADNTFDQEAGRIDFTNDGCSNNMISYWWADPLTPNKPVYTTCVSEDNDLNGVLLVRPTGNCLNRAVHTPAGVSVTQMAANVEAQRIAYGTTRYLYDQLMDGGDPEAVVEEITSSWPEDAWELRADLLSWSPYLSVDALQSVMDLGTFPTAMKVEVCVANPEATQSDGFMDWLKFGCLYPLDEEYTQMIIASWENRTYRSHLEGVMAYHHDEMTQAAHLRMEMLYADTVHDPLDSLRLVWQQLPTAGARYAEALSYLQVGAWSTAYNILDSIDDQQEMTEDELSERDRMLGVIDILSNAAALGHTPDQLDLAERNALDLLTKDAYDRAATWGQNLLCFYYDQCTAPTTGGESMPKSLSRPSRALPAVNKPMLVVMPNPASAWATFDFDLKSMPNNACIVVHDAEGRLLDNIKLGQTKGQYVWDTRDLAPGMYQVALFNNGQHLHAEKLIVKP